MVDRDRRVDRAVRNARAIRDVSGREVLLARAQAGLSQDAAGDAVGMSGSQFGRIERAELRNLTVEQLCRAAAAVGLRPSVRLYPDSDPLRDAGHARVLERFRALVPDHIPWNTEVGLPGQGELRSWDALVTFPSARDAVEVEMRVLDAQATWRRTSLKLRDDPRVDHVILVVADTPANRRAIAAVRNVLRSDLPLDTRTVLAAVRAGRTPGASGIAFL